MANQKHCAIYYTPIDDLGHRTLMGYIFDPHFSDTITEDASMPGTGNHCLSLRYPDHRSKPIRVSDEKLDEIKKHLVLPVEPNTLSSDYCKDYIEAHGEEYVLYGCIEECTELIKAITKLRREDLTAKDNPPYAPLLDNLAEEIVDVYACLEFIRILYDIKGSEELEEGPWAVKSDPKRYLKHVFSNLTSVINICADRLQYGTNVLHLNKYVQNVLRYARNAIQPIIDLYDIKDEDIKFWIQFKQNRGRYRINQIKESKK